MRPRLAFCWAHVRRDFLKIAAGYPVLKEWALDWVAEIGTLYHLNHQRLAQWQETLPLARAHRFCVTYPEVPMDNNRAEQAIRNPVTGRKNYYSSGSVWSAELAAMMFSLFQTIELRQLITDHPECHRADLSRQVCRMLQWYKQDAASRRCLAG